MPLLVNHLYLFDEFELDPARRSFSRNGETIPLSAKTFEVLTYLVAHSGRVVTKDELLKAVWPESFVEESNLQVYVSGLRKVLRDRANFIVTVPGQGYHFTARVEEAVPGDAPVDRGRLPELQLHGVREQTRVIVDEITVNAIPVSARGASIPQPVRLGIAAVVVVGIVLAGWEGANLWRGRRIPAPEPFRQIVLADFVNTTGNPNFDRTLRRVLEIDLAQSPYMDVLSEASSVDTLQLMGRPKDSPITAEIAREICERTNREVLVTGMLTSLGQRYVLTLEASNCASGERLADARADASTPEGVLEALDMATEQVRRGLHESAQSVAKYDVPLQTATTSSLEALKAYSVGMYLDSQGHSPTECLQSFQRAVELDPKFAMAYRLIGVENMYLDQTEVAAQNYKKAFELSGPVSAREQMTIRAGYYAQGLHDLINSIRVDHLWASTFPQSKSPLEDEAVSYMTLGQWDKAASLGEEERTRFPTYALVYENLATTYRSLNRFDDARTASLKAAEVGKGDTGLHLQLFLIAVAQQDQESLSRENQWFDAHEDGATVWFYPAIRGDALASAGEWHRAEEMYSKEYHAALRANLPEAADGVLLNRALAEFRLGFIEQARATLQGLQRFGNASPEAAVVQAEVGNVSFATRFLASHNGPTPDTLMTYAYLPQLKAALDLHRHKPLDALAALEAARPYELRDYSTPTLRGEAYLAAGQPDHAVAEFKKIADNPGIDSTSVLYPLAHLGLARAFARMNDHVASRKEYELLFGWWKHADPELPILRAARAEYARL